MIRTLALIVSALGLALALVAGLLDRLGLGGSPGLGIEQLVGVVLGWTAFVLAGGLTLALGRVGKRARISLVAAALVLWIVPVVALTTSWLRREERLAAEAEAANDTFMLDALVSIGYVDWGEAAADPAASGATRWDRDRAWPGYTLISSRERPEVYLFDMGGQVAHAWSLPDTAGTLEGARLQPNGDLLVISKFHELARLDWDSKVVWRTPLEAHHDVTVMPDGHLYTWVREIESFWGLPVRFPFLAKLSPDGEVVARWSTFEHLDAVKQAFDERSFLDGRLYSLHRDRLVQRLLGRLPEDRVYDFFHPNTVQRIESNAHAQEPAFRPGNLIVCLRNINQIATLDPATMEILWTWGEGELQVPHHPTVLPSGNILVFDNGAARGYTRILEIDPITERIEWQYPLDPDDSEHRFFSAFKGSAQRLPNGNTLIADGENGRSVEVTSSGEIVWEFFYPEINELGQRAAIYRSIRYPEEWVDELLGSRGARRIAPPGW